MKRKVFSLMMLCLLAFLGVASAQQDGGMTVTPDPIDLGYRPLGAWMWRGRCRPTSRWILSLSARDGRACGCWKASP